MGSPPTGGQSSVTSKGRHFCSRRRASRLGPSVHPDTDSECTPTSVRYRRAFSLFAPPSPANLCSPNTSPRLPQAAALDPQEPSSASHSGGQWQGTMQFEAPTSKRGGGSLYHCEWGLPCCVSRPRPCPRKKTTLIPTSSLYPTAPETRGGMKVLYTLQGDINVYFQKLLGMLMGVSATESIFTYMKQLCEP